MRKTLDFHEIKKPQTIEVYLGFSQLVLPLWKILMNTHWTNAVTQNACVSCKFWSIGILIIFLSLPELFPVEQT